MRGKRQHHLPAAIIGGFGRLERGRLLRDAAIVVKDLRSGEIRPSTAAKVAHRRALYRLEDPPVGVDADAIDKLWDPVERQLPALVTQLTGRALVTGDDQLP